MKIRAGEPEKTWFRTERFFTIGSDWFVATREGSQIGPFRTRQVATNSLGLYVAGVKEHKNPQVQARRLSTDCWTTTNFR